MEKDDKAFSRNLTLFATLLFPMFMVSCTPLLIGQAAVQGTEVVAVAAASAASEDRNKDLKDSIQAFNNAFKFEDYPRAFLLVSPDKKETFWSEADRMKGQIQLAEYELRDIQFDEKKHRATIILNFQYWRTESPILKSVSLSQEWQYFEKNKTWRVGDSGFEAILSNSP